MNAQLKPIPLALVRPEYRGYHHVSRNEKAEWIRLNADLLAQWFEDLGATLADCSEDTLDSFAEAQFDAERQRRDDYANTLRQYE